MIEVADLSQATMERAWVEDGGLVLPTGSGIEDERARPVRQELDDLGRSGHETAGPTEITC